MTYYQRLGEIPRKRHTQFRQPDGSLYSEELVSSRGFSGIYSNLYHINPPTRVLDVLDPEPFDSKIAFEYPLKQTHLKTSDIGETGTDYLSARLTLLKNKDVSMALCNPSDRSMDYYYKNGEADEVIFIHDGSGFLLSQFGKLKVEKGDYVVIPRTTIYRFEWDDSPLRLMIIASAHPVETVKRYRNEMGQLLEHSPYCERDIRPPSELITEDQKGEFIVKIKKGGF